VSLGDLPCKSLIYQFFTIRNQQVAGSIPAGGSSFFSYLGITELQQPSPL
jgi:hypothetical protein